MSLRFQTMFAVMAALIAAPVFGQTSRPAIPTVADQVHRQFTYFADGLNLSTDQKAKADNLEKKTAETLENDRAKRQDGDYQKQIVKQFGDMLTADQKKIFDARIARSEKIRDGIMTSSDLHQIALACIIYSADHQGNFPADLGGLAEEKLGPAVFLLPGSKTKPPADWPKMDEKSKADWINANSEFVFSAGGKDQSKLDANFVAGYVKPELATDGNWFMYADGSVHAADKQTAEKALAELKAGTNPPPSLAGK